MLLLLAAISILSITRINELNSGIDELADGRIPKIVLADEMERRECERRGLLPRIEARPLLPDLLPWLFSH